MAKIIKIEQSTVFIGTDTGEVKEVKRTALDFQPNIGDIVEIFGTDENPIIILATQNTNNLTTNTHTRSNFDPPPKKAVNKITYCVLAFLVGGLGAHKFYEGKMGLGIIYIVFCWTFIPAIIAGIEMIIALCKPADEHGNIYL